MKTHEELIKKDIAWHSQADAPGMGLSVEYAAGFVAGLKQALSLCAKFPDWEDVAEKLGDALSIYGEVLDDMPTAVDDMIGDAEKSARVEEACSAYKSAHLRVLRNETVV